MRGFVRVRGTCRRQRFVPRHESFRLPVHP
jgi:hypothetical protein